VASPIEVYEDNS